MGPELIASDIDSFSAGRDCCIVEKIDAERIRAHVRFLSHDLLEGRGTGQRGGDIAAEYIATQFALDGLKPAGDNGTYMQKVPMVGITPAPESTFAFVRPKVRLESSSLSPNTWLRRNSATGFNRECGYRLCRLRHRSARI